LPHTGVRAPYTEGDVALLLMTAETQADATRRRRVLAMLHLGLGAGCGPNDLRYVHGTDVEQTASGVVVHIGGPRPRSVPVLAAHAEPLVHLAATVGDGLLIGGKPNRRAVTGEILAHLNTGHGAPDLDARRLRSTWLLRHLVAGTRLDVLVAAAGLRSLTSLEDLLPHMPPPAAPKTDFASPGVPPKTRERTARRGPDGRRT
jgi:hypothetical protein